MFDTYQEHVEKSRKASCDFVEKHDLGDDDSDSNAFAEMLKPPGGPGSLQQS